MAPNTDAPRIILASGSRIRRELLQAAGLPIAVIPADIDEPVLRHEMMQMDPVPGPRAVAEALARAKAEEISRSNPAELTVGCDQVLDFEGEILAKPADAEAARNVLLKLRGQTHRLHSAVALAEEGAVVWSATETATLTMRNFSDRFLDDYIARGGAALCQSAGAYQVESIGIQLFERIEGDHFTVLGLPLMMLLAELRKRKVIAA